MVPERKPIAELTKGVMPLDLALAKAEREEAASSSQSESKESKGRTVSTEMMSRAKRVMHEMRQLFKVCVQQALNLIFFARYRSRTLPLTCTLAPMICFSGASLCKDRMAPRIVAERGVSTFVLAPSIPILHPRCGS